MNGEPIARIDVASAAASWPIAEPLLAAVWPPEVVGQLPWKDIVWAAPDRRLLAFDARGALVGHAQLFLRRARWEDRAVTIAGIGAVATRADQRRRGIASAVMRRAVEEATTAYGADFALLFCEPRHRPVYEKLGWRRFDGDVFAVQPQGRIRFTVTDPCVFDLKLAPRSGTIDLCGLPW